MDLRDGVGYTPSAQVLRDGTVLKTVRDYIGVSSRSLFACQNVGFVIYLAQ